MARGSIPLADLARAPGAVARGLSEWIEGDHEAAVLATLAASGRDLHARGYTLWAWTGRTDDDVPAWALPVPSAAAVAFRPRGPALALARCLEAAAAVVGSIERVRLTDWHGFVCLVLPGAEEELAELALEQHHEPPARVRLAELPHGVALGGPELALEPLARAGGDGLLALAYSLGVHPVRVALSLAANGVPADAPAYDPELAASLRLWGLDGEPPVPDPEPEPSLAVEDDPCPRRRHARRLLRRLLRMGKVGVQYHTSFDHVYRGAAPDARAEALAVGEALLRAGLLGEKPSVGQRHVYLRREALPEIHALIDRAETRVPALAEMWTAPAPGEGLRPPAGGERGPTENEHPR